MLVYIFFQGLLDGNLLSVADEDGHVKLIDTRKTKELSLIKGSYKHITDINRFTPLEP